MLRGSLEGQIVSNPAYQKSDFAGGSNSSKDLESPDQNSDYTELTQFSDRLKSRQIRREDIQLDKFENSRNHELHLEEVGQGNFSVVYKGMPLILFIVVLSTFEVMCIFSCR